jgi:acyl carrier protein
MPITTADIVEIFECILIRDCAADDNFFDVGGDSLLAETLVIEVSKRVGFEVEISALLDYPTPQELADYIQARRQP